MARKYTLHQWKTKSDGLLTVQKCLFCLETLQNSDLYIYHKFLMSVLLMTTYFMHVFILTCQTLWFEVTVENVLGLR